MSDSPESQSWYRVSSLKPRLKSHAEIHRQRFRGELWYVLEDHASGRYHRFTPAANQIIGMMNGKRSVQEIWDLAESRLGDEVPSQDEVVRLLAQLHSSDLLQADVPPDFAELSQRHESQRRSTLLQTFRSPLAIRFPLMDPDRFLTASLALMRPWFTWFGFVLWLAVIVMGVTLAVIHWTDLTKDITDRVLSVDNLVVLFFVFPVVKALHELGHGYATKVWGGEVHEMGIMLLVLMPVPYVDASAASAFTTSRRRMIVGAAGIMVESFLAACAMLVWINVEAGMTRAIAYNVMLIAGVSTLLFNGNPLLRFDGYYIFADWLQTPNLASRSSAYLGNLIQRYLFGVDAEPVMASPSERPWFATFALASFLYRMFVMTVIVMFVATKFFIIGVIIAIWAVILMFVMPLSKNVMFLASSPRLRGHRTRALVVTCAIFATLAVLFFLAPVQHSTMAEGVVWVPEKAKVYAASDGFVSRILAVPNEPVEADTPLIEMVDSIQLARVRVIEAQLKELQVAYTAAKVRDRVQAAITGERMKHTEERLANARESVGNLIVGSPTSGVFLLPAAADLAGRFLRKGELIGYVVDFDNPRVRVVVTQDDIDLVRGKTLRVDVRLAERIGSVIAAEVAREVPAALDRLPSVALGSMGGGLIPIDPSGVGGDIALRKVFQFELKLDPAATALQVGGRVFVRFDHGTEALAWQAYRALRQLFLSKFDV